MSDDTIVIEVTGNGKKWKPGSFVSFWGVHGPEPASYKIIQVLDDRRLLCEATPYRVSLYGDPTPLPACEIPHNLLNPPDPE